MIPMFLHIPELPDPVFTGFVLRQPKIPVTGSKLKTGREKKSTWRQNLFR